MPFIWDDLYWHVVDKDEVYDKNRFAVVRTLFIQLNPKYYYYTKALKSFNRVHIRKEFENYGKIESVQLLDRSALPEAYITFVDDKSAGMAFGLSNCLDDLKITEREYLCFKKYIVHIANTWHQTTELKSSTDRLAVNDDDDHSSTAIFRLNEDCLRHIFTFCDLESLINLPQVCKSFNDLLSIENGSTTYRHFKTLQLAVDVVEKDRLGKLMTVGKARKLLRHVGPFINRLIIKKLDEANVQRYFEKIAQYVGEDIKELEIYDVQLTHSLVRILKPLLQRLHVLKMTIFKNSQDIDFEVLCPNLKKLKIAGIMNMERSCKHWPNLKYVSLISDILSPETCCAFINLNVQLIGLKFFYQSVLQVQSIVLFLKKLEKLEINNKYKQIPALQLKSLGHLSQLNQLTLWNLKGEASIVEIFLTLIEFKCLRVLKLHMSEDQDIEPSDSAVYELKQQTLTAVAQKLSCLEALFLFNIKLGESTVLDIVRSASKLKVLHIHALNSNTEWKDSLITGIVNTRKVQLHEHLLKLFLDKKLNISLSNEDQRYLRMYCHQIGCRHARLKHCKK